MKQVALFIIVLSVALLGVPSISVQAQSADKTNSTGVPEAVIVFVCEHGAAKSIVAAAYFNKLAAERNLKFRAIARGTTPQEEIAVSAAKGLRADGMTVNQQRPVGLTKDDIAGAARVVSFCSLPEDYYKAAKVEEWNDVQTVGEDYNRARDTIVEHVKRLLGELEQKK